MHTNGPAVQDKREARVIGRDAVVREGTDQWLGFVNKAREHRANRLGLDELAVEILDLVSKRH